MDRIRADHPSGKLHGYAIRDSSNILYVGWQDDCMIVWFKSGGLYRYEKVSRQRAVACARAKSVGKYLNAKVKPTYAVTRIA